MGRHAQRRKNRAFHRRPYRRRVTGTSERPRLSVYRSGKHIYAQIINDDENVTLAAVSTLTPAIRKVNAKTASADAATAVGTALAERAKGAGVTKVVFDRASFSYHGRVKALAEAARKGGLSF